MTSQFDGSGSATSGVTDTCPRCCSRALVVEGYRVPGLDRLVTQAFCTSCGFVSAEPEVSPSAS
jgi:C4-type Zn-finger protein